MPDQSDPVEQLMGELFEAEGSLETYRALFTRAELERKRLLLDNMLLRQQIAELKHQIAHINDQRYKHNVDQKRKRKPRTEERATDDNPLPDQD